MALSTALLGCSPPDDAADRDKGSAPKSDGQGVEEVQPPDPADPEAALAFADEAAAALGLERFQFDEGHMGTLVVIAIYAEDEDAARAAADAGFAEIARLESVMSDYPESFPDSELLQLAAHAGEGPREVSDDLWPVLVRAKEVHDASGGAFDITAKPFTQLWRISRERMELPPDTAIERHRPLVGMEHLHLDSENQTAHLDTAGGWLDVGGIAKGYIADAALAVVREAGFTIAQVRAGGDMALGDAPPGLPGWPVNVPDFPLDDDNVGLAFYHANGGASVSGDAFRVFEIDGVRYSHVVDPRTGLGVTGSRYCCVKGPSAFATDAAATTGCILDEAAFNEAVEALSDIEGPLEAWQFIGASE